MTRPRVCAVIGVTLLLTAPGLGPTSLGSAASAADALCQGRTPTIAASSGTVSGTEGDDVILVTGPATVLALGGNDVVCVQGGLLLAGDGNDSVVAGGTARQVARLGAGDDHYTGGAEQDVVDPLPGDSAGTDAISTGGGEPGKVDTIKTGVAGAANHDVVDLGGTGGFVEVVAPAGSDAQLTGLANAALTLVTTDDAAYTLDLEGHTVTRDGVLVTSFTGFGSFRVEGGVSAVTVLGTPDGDAVDVAAAHLELHLGAGDDTVVVRLPGAGAATRGLLDLGRGRRDKLVPFSQQRVAVDLARRRLLLSDRHGTQAFRLSSITYVEAVARRVTLEGDERNNLLYAYGCQVRATGRGGNDWLMLQRGTLGFDLHRPCASSRAHFAGGVGEDYLEGSAWRDVLLGGAGRDEAAGHGGGDVCAAEIARSCG